MDSNHRSRVFEAAFQRRRRDRFVADSSLEGDGFEPSVPDTKEPVFVSEGELRDRTGAAKKGCFLCGTDGSNPSPSRDESANFRSPGTHYTATDHTAPLAGAAEVGQTCASQRSSSARGSGLLPIP